MGAGVKLPRKCLRIYFVTTFSVFEINKMNRNIYAIFEGQLKYVKKFVIDTLFPKLFTQKCWGNPEICCFQFTVGKLFANNFCLISIFRTHPRPKIVFNNSKP